MLRKDLIFALALAVTSPLAGQQDRQWYTPGSRTLRLNELVRSGTVNDTMGLALVITLPRAEGAARVAQVGQVFTALAAAYAQLKIPLEIRDSSRLMVGNSRFSRRGDIGGKSLAAYLECGNDINGVFAEIYPVSMALVTFLTPQAGDDLELRTVLFASAVDIPRAKPNTAECGSNGELERRLVQMTLKTLGKDFKRAP